MNRVLVVDDEPSICQIISTLLDLEGFEVMTAPDGRAALQCVIDTVPDFVLSDMRMPHMNGFELIAAIRSNPQLASVRCILLAGFSDDDPATAQALALADACVNKPFTREALLDTLRSLRA